MAIVYSMIDEKKKKYPLIDLIYYRQKKLTRLSVGEKKLKKKNTNRRVINLENYLKNVDTPEGAA